MPCPVCNSPRWEDVERRDRAPVAQNILFRSAADARACPAGELDFVRCRDCGFVWNRKFDGALVPYGASYENDQSHSGVFEQHMDHVADQIAASVTGVSSLRVAEVGCGQGVFLARLAKVFGSRLAHAIGFDPAWRGDAGALPGNVTIVADYLSPRTAGAVDHRPDIVVSRHTIEHVPAPLAFLACIVDISAPTTKVFVETPCVDWILDGVVVNDFFYEHCSLFNRDSLEFALNKAGITVEAIEHVFFGQYLLASGYRVEGLRPVAARSDRADASGYRRARDLYVARWRDAVEHAARAGKVALWGGGSKGVTIALLLGEDIDKLACAIDINPRKENTFLPVSGLPVVSPGAAYRAGVRTAFVVNPAYLEEIEALCAREHLPFKIVSCEALA